MRIGSASLPLAPAHRLAFDGDFGVADRDHAEQERAAEPADRGAERHEGEEHQHPAIAFKAGGLEQLEPGEPAPMPSAAPPSAPSIRPNNTSNAIFMGVFLYRQRETP
jgi:hypothetical protein